MVELGVMRLLMFLRWVESTILEFGNDIKKASYWIRSNGNHGLHLLWLLMHLILSTWYFIVGVVNTLESYLISNGFLKKYKNFDISKVQYLAVVIDSEEALQTTKVLELLRWLASTGLTRACLYDAEGVLKKSKDALTIWLRNDQISKEVATLVEQKYMDFEVISFSDGKHAVARAANFILDKHYLSANIEKPNLTESDMSNALGAIGYGGPEPDLMLIYGPARCHMGFPAWKLRYTEIVHMGSLKSMKFGALIKAIRRFTMVHQNYGQ